MRKFSYDDLEPQERMEFDRVKAQRDALLAALKRTLGELEWCAQWITGEDDAKQVAVSIEAAKVALKNAKK